MAKFTIKSLNYISHGDDRTFINMDVDRYSAADLIYVLRQEDQPKGRDPISGDVLIEQGPGKWLARDFISKEFKHRPSLSHALSEEEKNDDIILNEQFSYFEQSDPDIKAYVRLYLNDSRKGLQDELHEFNKDQHMINQTYEIENSQINSEDNQLYSPTAVKAMYDIRDVALKSRNPSSNANITKFDVSSDMTEDIYLPQMKTSPRGFCQVNDMTFLLTDQTTQSPSMIKSSLTLDDQYSASGFSHLILSSDQVKTYIYSPLSSLGTSSYSDYFLSATSSDVSAFFVPKANLKNVKYNYVAEIPLIGQDSLTTDYKNGNVYGYFSTTKNAYNSTYSVDMSSVTSLANCRKYISIGKSADVPYLTYYDSDDYMTPAAVSLGSGTKNISLSSVQREKVPYQKVETFHPISYSDTSKHKPTLFSVKLNGTGLDPSSDQLVYGSHDLSAAEKIIVLRQNIRQDITNAIRDIAKNVSPAQAQLIDVYFKG